MATQYLTESRYPQMPSGFSIVVDDVDGDEMPAAEEVVATDSGESSAGSSAEPVEVAVEAVEALPGLRCQCGTSHERRGSSPPQDPQLCSERVRQIKVEAQSRKNEFAKLLEEHAQVVLRVKQMEERDQQLQQAERSPSPPSPTPSPSQDLD